MNGPDFDSSHADVTVSPVAAHDVIDRGVELDAYLMARGKLAVNRSIEDGSLAVDGYGFALDGIGQYREDVVADVVSAFGDRPGILRAIETAKIKIYGT